MIPSPWVTIILTLGAYRLLRLIGWDDFPPVLKVRSWLIGEHWVPLQDDPTFSMYATQNTVDAARAEARGEPSLPGKQPDSEADHVRPAYRRPLLAHFIHCPFCVGFWISVAVYVAWLEFPTETLYALFAFALSGAIGLISKNWDA